MAVHPPSVPVEPEPPKASVAPVPVRQLPQNPGPAAERTPAPQAPASEEGDFWMTVVQNLVEAGRIQSLTRELALQSQLVARDQDTWLLRIERESLQSGQTRDKLQQALALAGHNVSLTLEMGRVTDSPAKRLAHAARQRQAAAEQLIEQDPYVQQLIQRYGATIVPGSIQPT